MSVSFRVLAVDGAARAGVLSTPHGLIRTPAFMPVGTAATVKAVPTTRLRELGADIILANTYHLMVQPGAERIAELGGLHDFMRWPHPILTDSGGFQIMSLAGLRSLDETGVVFRSHRDGSAHSMTPERSIEIQGLLGTDIRMVLDICLSAERNCAADVHAATARTLRWAERCRIAFDAHWRDCGGLLFGIGQGGSDVDLRRQCAAELANIGFDGYAIGGLALGENRDVMMRMIAASTEIFPSRQPRYLMGAGRPEEIVEAVSRGVDMFDCVLPTRAGRHGRAYTRSGQINLRNKVHADDPRPLDIHADCDIAARYPRAYLHHLIKSREILASILLSELNIRYYQTLMGAIRQALHEGYFATFRQNFHAMIAAAQNPR